MRIAMWSGPRNLSSAIMYSFGNRMDTKAIDEPFYGAFLQETGVEHPMRAEILTSMRLDPQAVIADLANTQTLIQYEKHMIHHMVPAFPMEWLFDVTNVFLLRHPARVLASYLQKREAPTADDLGFTQQKKLFEHVCALGQAPILVDSKDIRATPEETLRRLCAKIGILFDPAMLQWPAGSRSFDGVWASHWYGNVHASTCFAGAEGPLPDVPYQYSGMIAPALEVYEELCRNAL